MSSAEQTNQSADWNGEAHLNKVKTDTYRQEVDNMFVPLLADAILSLSTQLSLPGTKLLHDIGGYDGVVAESLIRNRLGNTWRGIVTDSTVPTELAGTGFEFHQSASRNISEVIGDRKIDASIICNVLHVLDDDEIDATVTAIKETSRPRSALGVIALHPVTYRREWSDFAGRNAVFKTERRGVFIDDYTPTTIKQHGFIKGVDVYPRTVESQLTMFIRQGLQLRGVEAIHTPIEYIEPGRDARYYPTRELLPSYLFSSWLLP